MSFDQFAPQSVRCWGGLYAPRVHEGAVLFQIGDTAARISRRLAREIAAQLSACADQIDNRGEGP